MSTKPMTGRRPRAVRESLPLDADDLPEGDRVDDRTAKDVAAGVDPVRHRLRHLLEEGRHTSVLVHGHAAERARILDFGEVESDVRIGLAMPLELGGQVVAGQHVAVEDKDGIVGFAEEVVGNIADRAAGSQRDILR